MDPRDDASFQIDHRAVHRAGRRAECDEQPTIVIDSWRHLPARVVTRCSK